MPFSAFRPLCAVALCAAPVLLAGCTIVRETQPAHTASEELLVSHAAEIAADKLAGALPKGKRVFVDDAHLKGDGADYMVSAIRGDCLKYGLRLAPDKGSAQIVVEVRMGAMSIDSEDTLLGIPAVNVAAPGTLTAVPIPELSAYSRARRRGTAELTAFAYDAKTGDPLAFIGPMGGARQIEKTKILTVFGSGDLTEDPGPKGESKPRR